MGSSEAHIGRCSCLFKCGVLKHTLEGHLACLNVEFSSMHWKVFLHVKMWSSEAYIGRTSRLFKCGVLKHTLEGLLACLNVEFPSIHRKVFLLV